MRSLTLLFGAALASGCATSATRLEGPLLELAHDEGRPSQKPLTPGRAFEMLIHFDPKLPSYRLERLRFRLAQPGRIVIAIYADAGGKPGRVLKEIDHRYGPELVGAVEDGKWLVEDLGGLPLGGPIFVGLSSPEKEGDPRLFATENDTGEAFQRETDPPDSIAKIPRTPVLRIEVSPSGAR